MTGAEVTGKVVSRRMATLTAVAGYIMQAELEPNLKVWSLVVLAGIATVSFTIEDIMSPTVKPPAA